MRAVIIGLGGIGTHLAEPLCRILTYSKNELAPKRVLLIDGDKYENKNRERQRYIVAANKAEASRELLQPLFPELEIEAKTNYIDAENIFLFVREGDVVFLAVDNHATRNVLATHAQTLQNVIIFSGGNEEYDGNIQVYERKDGKDLTPPLTWLHPEIESPKDKNPAELGCDEIIQSGGTQILATNNMAASLLLAAYTIWLKKGSLPYHEVYFDLSTGNVRPVKHQWPLSSDTTPQPA